MHKKIGKIKINFKRIVGDCTIMFNAITKYTRRKGPSNLLKNGRCLKKCQGYQILLGIQKMLFRDEDGHLPTNYSPDMTSNMKFSPITSIDVESSFSLYKYILGDRIHITPEHIEQHIVINCFMLNT
jgi:hypothetical protein